jgi:Ni,Fe-hydrogenase III small subunit
MERISLLNLLKRPLSDKTRPLPAPPPEAALLANSLRRRFGRSLAIRHLDAGSCNACELELHALSGPHYDLEQYGISFTASPRHADVLLVTGIVTHTMLEALHETWNAMPEPKWLIASGQCAIDGHMFAASPVCAGPVTALLPVDRIIPGCPPSPAALIDGIRSLFA